MLTAVVLGTLVGRQWTTPIVFTNLVNPVITESSGIGASTLYRGVFYTHNDAGDTNRFFRFNSSGNVSIVTLTGAPFVDWEDMACVKVGTKNLLYFGDIGDNNSNRPNIKVYKFDEPSLTATSVSVFQTYTLTYPDGPHNCEALIVDPKTGDLYFATKNSTQTDIYRLPAPVNSGTFVLTKLGTIFPDTGGGADGRKVTAGDADPTGNYVILRTLTGALEYHAPTTFSNWWTQTPLFVSMPADPQGEGICYGQGGRYLYTSTEGNPCPIHVQFLKGIAIGP